MEKIIYRQRKGTNSNKWNFLHERFTEDDLMGLWVADMDFATAECIREALRRHVDFGVYGYDITPDSYYQAFIQWEEKYHGYQVKKEWIRYSPGVVAALNWLIQILTKPGDSIIIQTPVYYPFMSAVTDHGRTLIKSELINKNGNYSIDFNDFEEKITSSRVKAFVMSSPHNPVGRVWRKAELEKLLNICKAHSVYVISDEIHHDFIYEDHTHIPAATVGNYNDILVTLTSPSKTFNLAGLKNSIIIIPDAEIRQRYDDYTKKLHVNSGNSFGVIAAESGYTGGREWLESILSVVHGNYVYLCNYLKEKLPKVIISPLEGTYLAWLDFGAYLAPEELVPYLEGRCKLAMDYGAWFGGNADTFVRMNLATKRENIEEAVRRLTENI